eukprot:5983058-Pyramimonas_sp.AAC.1
MIKELADCTARMISWMESCPCHWNVHPRSFAGPEVDGSLNPDVLRCSCPLNARRGVEMATGDFD